MPRPRKFRAVLEDESDDEIVEIPFTKPPPVIIDLLESESGNESPQEGGSKRSPRKKSKKKKSKRDKDRERNVSADVASLGDQALEFSVSSLDIQSQVGRPDGESGEEVICGQVVESAASAEVANGSENVATDITSSSGYSSETPPSSALLSHFVSDNGASGSSSHLEKCIDTQSNCVEVSSGKRTEIGIVMAGTPVAQNIESQNQKKVKSRERKSKGEGKSRTRTMSATQRTNEEIVNFLTTLGIQMEPSAFESPVRRRRQPRKNLSQLPTDPEGTSTVSPEKLSPSLAINSDNGITPMPVEGAAPATPGAFVSVSQDLSSPSKREKSASKAKRQRQAISGDLSDYTISFTNKDLNDINTNIQSNILISDSVARARNEGSSFIAVACENNREKLSTSSKMRPDYYAEVIDAVARGLDSSASQVVQSSLEIETSFPVTGEAMTTSDNAHTVQIERERTEMDLGLSETVTENNERICDTVNFSEGGTVDGVSIKTKTTPDLTSQTVLLTAKDGSDAGTENLLTEKNCDDEGNEGNQRTSEVAVSEPVSTSTPDCPLLTGTATLFKSTFNLSEETVQNAEITARKSPVAFTVSSSPMSKSLQERNSNKRKFNDVESSENTENRNSIPLGVGVKGIENAKPSRQSVENKRHKSGNDSIITSGGLRTERINLTSTVISQTRGKDDVTTFEAPVESYFPTSWSAHMRDFYGSFSNENFELDEVWPTLSDSPEKWKAYKDMMPPPRNKRRHVRCDRCKQFGHLIKECKEKWKPPSCHYCGEGGHSSDNHSRNSRTCPGALCLNCGRRSSRYAQKCHRCLLLSRPNRCEICNVTGHDKSICPDNWRRYHAVTSTDDYEQAESLLRAGGNEKKNSSKGSKVYKRSSSVYCANCGKRGHSYYDCNGSKFNPYPRNKPFVIREVEKQEKALKPSTSAACIPISYDSRTGRTVLMNAEATQQPELSVETIQVKITNDLALLRAELTRVTGEDHSPQQSNNNVDKENGSISSKPGSYCVEAVPEKTIARKASHNLFNCENRKCRNKLRQDDRCYQILMETQAHSRLLKDQRNGILKPLEEKHQVQISVLNDGCRIHVYGGCVLDAEKNMYHLLWTYLGRKNIPATLQRHNNMCRINRENNSPNNVNYATTHNSSVRDVATSKVDSRPKASCRSSPSTPTSKTIEVVTVEDNENDNCCIVTEIGTKINGSNMDGKEKPYPSKNLQTHAHGNQISSKGKGSHDSFFIDPSPARASIEPEPESTEEIENERPDLEAKINDKESAKVESPPPRNTFSMKSSWSDYVSPLSGLSLDTNTNDSSAKVNLGDEDGVTSSSNEKVVGTLQSQHIATTQADTAANMAFSTNSTGVTVNDDEMFEVEEFDYANAETFASQPQLQENAEQSQSKCPTDDSSSSDSEIIVLDPPPVHKNVEVVTIDDEDETMEQEKTFEHNEETVTLLTSEWDVSMAELARKNNVINQISQEFQVDIIVSKEKSSIIIRNGTDESRRLAKEEVVYWLECRSFDTDYHLARRRREQLSRNQTPNNFKRKKPKKRALRLNDVQQQLNVSGELKSNKKRKRKPRRKLFNGSVSHADSSFDTPSSSSSSFLSFSTDESSPVTHQSTSFSKRSFRKAGSSPAFNSKGRLHSPSPKKMQPHNNNNGPKNNNNVSFPIPSSKAYYPRKTRYFQPN